MFQIHSITSTKVTGETADPGDRGARLTSDLLHLWRVYALRPEHNQKELRETFQFIKTVNITV